MIHISQSQTGREVKEGQPKLTRYESARATAAAKGPRLGIPERLTALTTKIHRTPDESHCSTPASIHT